MIDGSYGRTALAAAAWFLSVAYYPAVAQTPTPKTASDAPVDFDIPSQPLASALNTWAVQANAQVFVEQSPVTHLTAPAVKGTLAPRQALRILLSHSNLMVVQGKDGVFVIRPRPVPAAAPREPVPPPLAAAAPVASAPAAPPTALASEGPWLLRLDADYVQGNGGAAGGGTAALGAEYFITDHVTGALSVTLPRSYSVGHLQPVNLTLKYYFTPEQPLRPYVGAGIDITTLYDAVGVGAERTSVGPMVQAGLDLRLNPHWMLNAEVSWAQVRSIVQAGLGLAYRF
jgi:outer membrane protein